MNGINNVKRIGALFPVLALLSACGGSSEDGDTSGGAQPAGTVAGAAGSTVRGPNGATVVIPPGALATNTTITSRRPRPARPRCPAAAVCQSTSSASLTSGENVLLQPDDKIVLGGLARNNVDGYGLARVLP